MSQTDSVQLLLSDGKRAEVRLSADNQKSARLPARSAGRLVLRRDFRNQQFVGLSGSCAIPSLLGNECGRICNESHTKSCDPVTVQVATSVEIFPIVGRICSLRGKSGPLSDLLKAMIPIQYGPAPACAKTSLDSKCAVTNNSSSRRMAPTRKHELQN